MNRVLKTVFHAGTKLFKGVTSHMETHQACFHTVPAHHMYTCAHFLRHPVTTLTPQAAASGGSYTEKLLKNPPLTGWGLVRGEPAPSCVRHTHHLLCPEPPPLLTYHTQRLALGSGLGGVSTNHQSLGD